jgi:MraZ protein
MSDFTGSSEVSVDDKGRLAFPFRLRRLLGPDDEDTLYMMPGFEGEIMVFPKATWDGMRRDSARPNPFDRTQRIMHRRFSHDSEPCKVDKQGRVMIPGPLRKWAKITASATVAGSGAWIEIWETAAYKAARDRDDDEAVKLANTIKLESPAPQREG